MASAVRAAYDRVAGQNVNIRYHHWHHFFGGVAVVLLVIQLLSGIALTLFYTPHLQEAYGSVQRLYRELAAMAWVRDVHRWAALVVLASVVLHVIRSLLRKDFHNPNGRTSWLVGALMLLPLLGFVVTGVILPWEWRGYWFMEMVPNYIGGVPVVGPAIADFLIDAFTLNRALMVHVVILPVISLVMLDIHALSRTKKRPGGIFMYLLQHGLLALPLLLAVALLAYAVPMPTEDPEVVPMPLEGENVPTVEWFILILYVPYLYFKGVIATLFGFVLPLAGLLLLALLPYLYGRRGELSPREAMARHTHSLRSRIAALQWLAPLRRVLGPKGFAKLLGALAVAAVAAAVFAPFYAATHVSPTLGCNSCHNTRAGIRMGIPPATFKDRVLNPNLKDNTFMIEHWFYPQVVW